MKNVEISLRVDLVGLFLCFIKNICEIAPPIFMTLFLTCIPGVSFSQDDKKFPTGDNRTCWQETNQIGCFTSMDKVFPMREIANGGPVLDLPTKRQNIRYRYKNTEYDAKDLLDHHRIMSLVILKDGKIVEEQYRYGASLDTRFYSASMAKTVVGMLVGIAIEKGLIKSIDDLAELYVPELLGTAYGKSTILNLLRMSSGVRMSVMGNNEVETDERRFFQTERGLRPQPVIDFLREVPGGEFEPGTLRRYVSTDTVVLGYVLTNATGKTVSDLLSDWIWKHIGAQQPAMWRLMKDGVEYGGGDLFATARDYGRLGMLLAQDGKMGDKQVIPSKWLRMATDSDEQPKAFRPSDKAWFGYGFQTWIFPLQTRTFGLRGAYRQSVFVQPRSGIVMVVTSALPDVSNRNDEDERHTLWYSVLRSLNGYLH
jgi:CubicO group peptidase (beta-lactamase class C family)